MRAALLLGMGGVLVGPSGCAVEPTTSSASAEVTSGTECDVMRCGTNSPVIDGLGFHELNLQGAENAQHMRYARFVQGTLDYTLHVKDGRLWGTRDGKILQHADLKGAQIIAKLASGKQIAITIVNVGTVHFWAVTPGTAPGAVPLIETYDLQWAEFTSSGKGEKLTPVCGNPARRDDTLGMVVRTAVVFEGDRIDADSKKVSAAIDPTWFNIGCAGHALAKLALTGHTEAARSFGYATTPSERQAMLKMFTGDYCGTGEAFTIPGQPLYWRDDHGWMGDPYPTPVSTPVEARWGADGAICLGAPRLDVNIPAATAWPAGLSAPIASEILGACPLLPPCANVDPNDLDGAHLVTANPK